MAKTDDAAATMLRNLPEKTGRNLDEWIVVLGRSALEKHGEMVKYLKSEHGVTHGFANFIVTQFRKRAEPQVVDLVASQYSGAKANLRPIYDKLSKAVTEFGDDVELAPKKAYVSLRRKKQFGLIQPSTKTRVDIGLNLPGIAPSGRLEKSGSFNAMVSHRVRIESVSDVNAELIAWLKKAYRNAG